MTLPCAGSPVHQSVNVEVIRPTPKLFGPIEVIDGDTVRMNGTVYRLAGFDTPERGDLARCDDERRRAEAAHPYVCGATSCPQRRPWCDAR